MKGKTILSIAIVLSMILSALPLFAVKAADPVTVEIRFTGYPPTTHEITVPPCTNFVAEVWITLNSKVIDFADVEIRWNPATLELKTGTAADVTEGPWMKSFGSTVFAVQPPNNALGILPDIACGYLAGGPAAGSGILCYIAFHCKAPGDSPITLYKPTNAADAETYLLMLGALVPIDVVIDGLVHQPYPPPTPPIASFHPDDGALIDVCTNVTLDGSGSTPGWDTVPAPGHSCPITSWKWEIDLGNDGSIDITMNETDPISWFHCTGPGEVKIKLTVRAPDPTPPTHVNYNPYDSETHIIMQRAPPIGAAIDVYTDRGGKGPLGSYKIGWSDAYGPQELVCVFAKVTYNNESVEYKPVGFEMNDPNGTSRDFRVAFTDQNGIATVCFRIPWEGMNAEYKFGNWSITGTVDVAGNIKSDTVKFRFGYLLSIVSVVVKEPLPPDGGFFKGETITVDVDIDNIAFTPPGLDALLTIVACDACGVPICLAADYITVPPEDGLSQGHTMIIPSWAFVGQGTLYVNLFTDYPTLGGVPYCHERTKLFTILKTP